MGGSTYDNPWQCAALVLKLNRRIVVIGPVVVGQTPGYQKSLPCEESVNFLKHLPGVGIFTWLISVSSTLEVQG